MTRSAAGASAAATAARSAKGFGGWALLLTSLARPRGLFCRRDRPPGGRSRRSGSERPLLGLHRWSLAFAGCGLVRGFGGGLAGLTDRPARRQRAEGVARLLRWRANWRASPVGRPAKESWGRSEVGGTHALAIDPSSQCAIAGQRRGIANPARACRSEAHHAPRFGPVPLRRICDVVAGGAF